MISLETLKSTIFTDLSSQEQFIAAANSTTPRILGNNFDEKLRNLVQSGTKKQVQILLAPHLREKVYRYLNQTETELARTIKQKHIDVNGELQFRTQLNFAMDMQVPSSDVARHFFQLRQAFIIQRGHAIWSNLTRATSPDFTAIDTEEYQQAKQQFLQRHSQAIPPDTDIELFWDTLFPPQSEHSEIGDLEHRDSNSSWELRSFSEDDSTGLPPVPPEPNSSYFRPDYLVEAQQLKERFIQQAGFRQWARIYNTIELQSEFDAVKNAFIGKWNGDLWNIYSATEIDSTAKQRYLEEWDQAVSSLREDLRTKWAPLSTQQSWFEFLDQVLLADFAERKQHYVNKWTILGAPDAWEQASAFPEISPVSMTLLAEHRERFIHHWGSIDWNNYLRIHRDGEYATDIQLQVLAELFDLRLEVTDITDNQHLTMMPLRETGQATVHFYCENNTHYFIHDNGYYETIGDGNCGYNGFAEWLQCLILGTTPRRTQIIIPADSVDATTHGLLQAAMLTDREGLQPSSANTPSSVYDLATIETVQSLMHEEVTIKSIRKQLAFSYNTTSASELAKLLRSRTQAIIQIIHAFKLPSNRITILEKILGLLEQCEQNNHYDNLIILQEFLLCITNTVYLPNTRDVTNWTRQDFEENIEILRNTAATKLQTPFFAPLQSLISRTDFLNKDYIFPSFFNFNFLSTTPGKATIPKYPRAKPVANAAVPTEEGDDDYLSAALCIAGIFIFLAGIIALIALLILACLMNPLHLGLMLMHHGLQSIAVSLSNVIGLSAPYIAVLVDTTIATMLTGVGFTLFKDFAPKSLKSQNQLFSFGLF